MNLAFLAKRYHTVGGTEKDLYELTRRLAARGHEVHVYCGQQRTPAAAGVTLHPVPIRLPGRTALLKAVAHTAPAMARAAGHDLVYSFARTVDQDVIRCGGGIHKAFLGAMEEQHGLAGRMFRRLDPYHRAMLRIEQDQYKPGAYREITAISRVVRNEILQHFAVPPESVTVIYDGIDMDRFSPERLEPLRDAARKRAGLKQDQHALLFVGNGFARKGLDAAIGALDILRHDCVLLVVGTDQQEAHYRDAYHRLVREGRLHFAGVQDDPLPYYAAADALVLPSRHEAFGNVVIEALASGIPAAVSSRAGASEILEGRFVAGLIAEPAGPEQTAQAITKILQSGLTAADARTIASRYTFDANAEAIEAQCSRLVESHRRG